MGEHAFFVQDYQIKAQYLTDHFSRMWIRFNFFFTISAALLGFSFDGNYAANILPMSILGLLTSGIWLCFGLMDRRTAKVYRGHVSTAYCVLRECFPAIRKFEPHFSYVGDPDQLRYKQRWRGGARSRERTEIERAAARWRVFGVTILAVAMPLFFALAWVGRLVWWCASGDDAANPWRQCVCG